MSKILKMILMFVIVIAAVVGIWCGINKKSTLPPTTKEPIKIGAILPLTGPAANLGNYAKEGIDLAIEEINQQSGTNGPTLKVIYEDSQSQNQQAVTAVNKLVNVDKVPVVFVFTTSDTDAVLPIIKETKVILWTNTVTPGITEKGNGYVFRNGTGFEKDLQAMFDLINNKFQDKKLAVIYFQFDFSQWLISQLKENLGNRFAGTEVFERGATDFRGQLTKLKDAKPDLLYVFAYNEAGLIMKQARELGMDCQFLAPPGFESQQNLLVAGPAAEGTIYTNPDFITNSSEPRIVDFQKKFMAKYNKQPEVWAATWYDAIKILALAIKNNNNNPEAIKNELLKIQNYQGVTGNTSFKQNGDVEKPVILKTVKDGQFVPYQENK
ncbi:MAG: ABC transporter substrate-binding protein [Patescibacteria group bacterium]|nr:ABC transporter substrate-binding protein [Patescibacteria group bacterium]